MSAFGAANLDTTRIIARRTAIDNRSKGSCSPLCRQEEKRLTGTACVEYSWFYASISLSNGFSPLNRKNVRPSKSPTSPSSEELKIDKWVSSLGCSFLSEADLLSIDCLAKKDKLSIQVGRIPSVISTFIILTSSRVPRNNEVAVTFFYSSLEI